MFRFNEKMVFWDNAFVPRGLEVCTTEISHLYHAELKLIQQTCTSLVLREVPIDSGAHMKT
jgi:hypothetical protein